EDEESKARGGDLTFFDKDTTVYPKAVVEASFKLAEVGDVSPPVKTDKGWVVLKLTQKRPGFNRPLAEVKHQIQQRLFRDTRTKALDTFIADLKKKTKIEYHDENLGKIVIENGVDGEAARAMPGALRPGIAPGSPMSPNMMQAPGALPGKPPAGVPAARPVSQGKP